jgi:hypothetical protein
MPIGSGRGNAMIQITDGVIHNAVKATEYIASAPYQTPQILISAHITSTKHHGFIELISDFGTCSFI